MKKRTILGGGVLAACLVAACSSSSSNGTPDAGDKDTGTTSHPDTGTTKKEGGTTGKDSGPLKDGATGGKDAAGDVVVKNEATTGDAGKSASHVLVTYDGTGASGTTSTMVAVNLATKALDGTLTSADGQAITDTSNTTSPFLLGQTTDVISALDAEKPWEVDSTWNVGFTADAGQPYGDTYAVTVSTGTQAYVIRYLSNIIDVINPAQAVDGGAPTSTVDLTSVVPAGAFQGLGRPVAGTYVASSNRVYVVLENLANYNFPLTCGTTKSSVTAIDTMTNAIVNLGGTGPGGSIELVGFDPIVMEQDVTGGRLLVFENGCEAQVDGATGGPQALAGVEAVDLTSSTSALLLDTTSLDGAFPTELVYIDTTHAILGFQYPTAAYLWDPTSTTIGATLPNAPSVFAYDGNGNLVGANVNFGDAGTETTDIVSMAIATGTATTLLANVTPIGDAYIGSVGVWPKP